MGLINIDGPDDRPVRAALSPAFTSERIFDYIPTIEKIVVDRTSHWGGLQEVDVLTATTNIAFDVAAAVILGMSPGADADLLRHRLDVVMNTSHAPTGRSITRDEQSIAKMHLEEMLGVVIEKRHGHQATVTPPIAVDLLLAARDMSGQPLQHSQLVQHLSVLMMAGYETTTTLGAWLLHELASDSSYGDHVDAEAESSASWERMPFLENAIREVGRLHPPVIFLPRVALSDVTFQGYTIPAGTPVFLGVGPGHRMESQFPDAHQFQPSRYLQSSPNGGGQIQRLATFGGGRRTCLGARLAVAELKCLVRHVRKNHRILPIKEQPPKTVESIVQWLPQGMPMQIMTEGESPGVHASELTRHGEVQ